MNGNSNGSLRNSRFSTVHKDRNFHSVKTVKRNKIPHYSTLAAVGGSTGQPGQETEVILNRGDRVFYGHNGNMWVPLSTVSGKYNDGFQATDGAGTIIDDNAAAGIATGTSAVAGGDQATATGLRSTALGQSATASSNDATALGQAAKATASQTTALGRDAQATETRTSAVGEGASASATDATAVGQAAFATGTDATAVGEGASASATDATAVGQAAVASTNATALGAGATADWPSAVALGQGAFATGGFTTVAQLGLPTAVFDNTGKNGIGLSGVIELNIGGTVYYLQVYSSAAV